MKWADARGNGVPMSKVGETAPVAAAVDEKEDRMAQFLIVLGYLLILIGHLMPQGDHLEV